MKKFTLLLVLFVTSLASAQLKTSEVKEPTVLGKVSPLGKTSAAIFDYGDYYQLSYRDAKFVQIDEEDEIIIQKSELEDIYALIVKNFEEKKSGEVKVELKEGVLYLKFAKGLGMISLEIGSSKTPTSAAAGYSQALTKKQVDKLFGKK